MAKFRQTERTPPPPPPVEDVFDEAEEHDVEDIDFDTFVYDDVEGHVVEQLPGLPSPDDLTSGGGLTNEPVPLAASAAADDPLNDLSDTQLNAAIAEADGSHGPIHDEAFDVPGDGPFAPTPVPAAAPVPQPARRPAAAATPRALPPQPPAPPGLPSPAQAARPAAAAHAPVAETPRRPAAAAETPPRAAAAARAVDPAIARAAAAATRLRRDAEAARAAVAAAAAAAKPAPTAPPTPDDAPEARRPMPTAAERPAPAAAAASPTAPPRPAPSRPMRDRPVEGAGGVVCPFCAHVRAENVGKCPRCTMEDTASTRRSTGERIGPWFVLQRKNPTAPGLRFSVLLTLSRRGHVTAKSIVRGPTTGQLWTYAGQVKGLSRVFGVCWHCQASVSPDAVTCRRCKSAQEIPDDPDQFLESRAAELMSDTAVSPAIMREVPAETSDSHADAFTSTPTPPPAAPAPRPRPAPTPAPAPAARPASREAARPAPTKPAAETPAAPARPAHRTPITAAAAAAHPDAAALSASELAAVFQLDPPPRPGVVRRTGRLAWRALRIGAVAAIVVAAAGAAALALKPEWREPTRSAADRYWTATRDGIVSAKDWTFAKSGDAWQSASTTVAHWRGSDEKPAVPASPTPIADANPPATPIRGDDPAATAAVVPPTPVAPAPTPKPTPKPAPAAATLPEGRPSVVDATPSPAKPPVAPAEDPSWDAILAGKSNAATQPAAKPTAPQQTANTPASKSQADADARTAALAADAAAAIRDAERALAESKAAPAATPTPAQPQSQQPQPQQPQQVAGVGTSIVSPNGTPPPQPAPPAPAAAQPPPMTLDAAMIKADQLRRDAIDAEGRHDWAGAVKLYEEIAKLPADAQPMDLKVRMNLARERARR